MAENREKILKFIWKVENYSYCWNKTGDCLKSPDFRLDVFEGSTWCLKLYPRGTTLHENYVGVYLERLSSSNGPLGITIDYEISLQRPNGANEYAKEMKDRCFRKGHSYGFNNLVTREEILGAKRSILLPEDTLTVQCRIFPKNTELETYIEVIAKTYTELDRLRLCWENIKFTPFPPGFFAIRMLSFKGSDETKWFKLCFPMRTVGTLTGFFYCSQLLKAAHCKIGILDSHNSVSKILFNDYIYIDISRQPPHAINLDLISVSEILKNKSLYLTNSKLNLYFEFTLCPGFQHSQIEGIARDSTFTFVPVDERLPTSQIELPPKNFLCSCTNNTCSSLKNDFHNLYQEGTLCDFTIKVESTNLQVHKAVLCARSPVFKAMITSNMKENDKNMVDISDLELDTVRRMLTFIYTDASGDLNWDTAKKLYFAADKYDLITLKLVCSEVLKQNLCVTNVGEALALANMHSDVDLKKKIIEFICDHETEVMCSAEWKTFMKEEVHLAAETMHHIFLKKVGQC